MAHFRNGDVVVEAWKTSRLIEAANTSWEDLPKPVRDAYDKGDVLFPKNGIQLRILGHWIWGATDSWVIVDDARKLHSCPAVIFAATYDEVS